MCEFLFREFLRSFKMPFVDATQDARHGTLGFRDVQVLEHLCNIIGRITGVWSFTTAVESAMKIPLCTINDIQQHYI